ncbi:tetratricopeptide repeat protein [Lusitaniella coriacea LEGE 07157]|uniref:Tetratricopeptide repeat protein n=1 Tax=Lusitaniella coriacea LEGE 07157 TaxID=945747 RepID=A0A8J7JBY1_9CYAN|nr:tetratricopeptide repeat protein [Lusitaniella coriacea]MBE9117250.1 tetratricopeptide repeat protein [Lusitaniella coriacea LEGE 07157]
MAAPRLVEVTGGVQLKREGASRFRPARRNTTLRRGDLLRPASGARVRVLCDDGRTRPVPAGVTTGVNTLCPPPRSTTRNGTVRPRTGTLDIPYIISPRATFLLVKQPTLRWNAATGAKNFTVTVRGRGFEWTEQVVRKEACQGNTCTLVYSGSPFQPGVNYKLVVKADTNRSSAEETTPGLGFGLIELEQRQEVQTIAQRIEEQDLSKEVKLIALADLYADYNLVAEALEILEEGVKTQPLAAAYRRLGDLYLGIGLVREAEVRYLEAIQLASEAGESEEKAAAQVGLSQVSEALNRREEAVRLLEEAIAGYENLGDEQRVNELKERLEKLQG